MICRKCGHDLPEDKFTTVRSHNTYTKRDGTVSHYYHSARRKVCNGCIWRNTKIREVYTDYRDSKRKMIVY